MNPLALLALGVAAAGGAYWLDRVANSVIRPTPRLPERSLPESGLAHEDIVISGAGHALAGWFVPAASAAAKAPLVLMAHGWGANYGTVLRLAEPLVRAGHDVLLFDMRGHGRNRAASFVTVRHMRDDVMAVVAYAQQRFPGRPLVLLGHSFGGAASVLAVAEGAKVAGLVLIATPSDVLRITAEAFSQRGLPGGLMVKVLRPFWWWRLGGTFRPHSVTRRIRELRRPTLILHPENDARVSREHAERLSQAAGIPYRLMPGSAHTDVLSAPMTAAVVKEFIATL
ncbi:MAG: alpha/beta hydrolase [Gemmatimonadetes bacterium]|nr:alpha/beta hydrolase [Gemmatimonadota bacterium]